MFKLLKGMVGDEGSQTTLTINAIHITGCKVHHINTKTGTIQRTVPLADIHLQDYGKGKAAEVLAELWGDVLQIVKSE